MMDRIRDEMARAPEDATVQLIGEHLTEWLRRHEGALFKEDATIGKAIEAMKEEARKKKGRNNWAALDFLTGMQVVYRVFGLTFNAGECMMIQSAAYGAPEPKAQPAAAPKPESQAHADEFDLDKLLGDL